MGYKTIGIFIPNIHKVGRHEYLDALCNRASEYGLKTMCFSTYTDLFYHDEFDKGEESIYYLAKKADLAGLVVYSELIKDDAVNRMLIDYGISAGIPVFTIDKKFENAYYIGYNYDKAFERITDHVIEEHGAKKICMISGMKDNAFSEARDRAFQRSLEKHGIPFDESNIYYGEFWEVPTQKAVEEIISDPSGLPDAIVCANDTMAIAACNMLEDNDIHVPEDIIVTGFDGIERASQNCPTITTAKYDYISSSNYIIDTIKAHCDGAPVKPCEAYFDLDIIPAQSCGCVVCSPRASGKITSQLYNLMNDRQEFRIHMDHMTLSYNNNKSITEIFSKIGKYVSTVTYAGMAIYLDPAYFGNPTGSDSEMVLACWIDPDTLEYHYPFSEYKEEGICSSIILDKYSNILFVPLHCQDRVYGYVAAGYGYLNTIAGDRLSDFVVHMNMLLSGIENSVKLNEMVEVLNEMYIRDPLTNLFNRRGFYREADELILRANMNGEDILIASVDLDGLKYINDTYGHTEGDFAIVSIADALSEITVENGICARFGGDEYLAALTGVDDPVSFEKKFAQRLEELNSSCGKPYSIMASIGTEIIPANSTESIQEAIKRADDKMFKHKKRSKFSRGFRLGK